MKIQGRRVIVYICLLIAWSPTHSRAGRLPVGDFVIPMAYPSVFDTLRQSLDLLEKQKPEVFSQALLPVRSDEKPSIATCRDYIKGARQSLFCLEYYQSKLTPEELGHRHEAFIATYVNATTVSALVARAHVFFEKNKIPFAKQGEFPAPRLP